MRQARGNRVWEWAHVQMRTNSRDERETLSKQADHGFMRSARWLGD